MPKVNDRLIKEAARLAGCRGPSDLLRYAPINYHDFQKILSVERAIPIGKTVNISATVSSPITKYTLPGQDRVERKKTGREFNALCGKNTFVVRVTEGVTTSPLVKLKQGSKITLHGKTRISKGVVYIDDPMLVPEQWSGALMPEYPSVKQTGNRLKVALPADKVPDVIDVLINDPVKVAAARSSIREEMGEHPVSDEAIDAILFGLHRPNTHDEYLAAREAAEDLSIRFILSNSRKRHEPAFRSQLTLPESAINQTLSEVPFTLSESQLSAVLDMVKELQSEYQMRRLLSGDVGSGKSIVQFALAAIVQRSGYQVAMTTPNGLLARQLYDEFQLAYPNIPIVFIGKNGNKKPDMSKKPVLVGTTAVLHFVRKKSVTLDFVTMDEEQKFGADQKAGLTGNSTNYAACTATAIPKSMGALLFSDMEISRIFPHCGKDIKTLIFSPLQRGRLFAAIQSYVDKQKKVAIIFGRINADDDTPSLNALTEAEEKWQKAFPGQCISLHGQMTEDEKEQAKEKIVSGEKNILLATTIVEIGMNIPGLEMIVTTSPELLGVSTHHQIRGRLCRAGGSGIYVMYCSSRPSESTMQRMNMVRSTLDGFKLAEMDMQNRGFGDVLTDGKRQHGKTESLFHNIDLRSSNFIKHLPEVEGSVKTPPGNITTSQAEITC